MSIIICYIINYSVFDAASHLLWIHKQMLCINSYQLTWSILNCQRFDFLLHIQLYFGKLLFSVSKYLGIIHSETNCDDDIKAKFKIYYTNVNILLLTFSYCSSDIKCSMFKSYSATMYCSFMW